MPWLLYILKFISLCFNVIILFFGILLFAIGIYARIETERFSDISSAISDPAVAIIIFGIILIFFGFFGAIGSLREIRIFLIIYIIIVGLFLLLEIVFVVVIFLSRSLVTEQANNAIRFLIQEYRENSDLRAAVDLVQISLACCGSSSFQDWELNRYFNCSAPGIEACGVPSSCCIQVEQINSQCGYSVRSPVDTTRLSNIEITGCLSRYITFSFFFIIATNVRIFLFIFLQLFSMCFFPTHIV